MDDYEMIKTAFKGVKTAKIEEDYDVERNPILRVTVGKLKMTFYFEKDHIFYPDYKEIANLSRLTVEEIVKRSKYVRS